MAKTLLVLVIVVLAASTVGYFLLAGHGKEARSTTSSSSASTPSMHSSTSALVETGTSTPIATSTMSPRTTSTSSAGSAAMTIWDFNTDWMIQRVHVAPSISQVTGKLDYWPVYHGGRFYPVAVFNGVYNITIKYMDINRTENTVFEIRYTLTPNQSFVAACVDPETGKVTYTERFNNVIRITVEMRLGDGAWYRYTAYLSSPRGLDYYSAIPDILDWPDPTAYKFWVLGATVSSPTGHLEWSYVAGKDPTDTSLVLKCSPLVRNKNAILEIPKALQKSRDYKVLRKIIDEIQVPVFTFIPGNLFIDELTGLAGIKDKRVLEDMVSDTPLYETYSAVIRNNGTTTIPGGDLQANIYRVEFTTKPRIATGYFILANNTIIPLEYGYKFTDQDLVVTVEFHLRELKVLWQWPGPAA